MFEWTESISPVQLVAWSVGFVVGAAAACRSGRESGWMLRLAFATVFGVASGGILTAFLTVVGLALDDWSACRLAPIVSLFYGYPLYATIDSVANGFAYGPVGAMMYLPAAAVAFWASSPTAGVLAGQITAFLFVLIPFLMVIRAYGVGMDRRITLALFAVFGVLLLATPPMRYVAFSIHVDAPAFFFAMLAAWFGAKSVSVRWWDAALSGMFVGAAVLSKQTMIPVGGVCLLLLLSAGWRAILWSAGGFLVVIAVTVSVLLVTGAWEGWVQMYLGFFTGLPRAMTLWESMRLYSPWVGLLIVVSICFLVALGWNWRGRSKTVAALLHDVPTRLFVAFLAYALGYGLLGIYTGAAALADSNHYAPGLYFGFLALCVYSLALRGTRQLEGRGVIAMIAALMIATPTLVPVIQRFPGWYLYENNFLEQAYQYSLEAPATMWFPWQPLSVLLGEGRMYHLGEHIYYEDVCGLPPRSIEQCLRFLPPEGRGIAIRPFGAPASVLPMTFPNAAPGEGDPRLPGWVIYRFPDGTIRSNLTELPAAR